MSNDEQTIYISPEDDLTNVRERLEKIAARHISLIIPRQTLLRSHVAWRNLYARSKELGKDVMVISDDAQIRSLAQAAKFRVAHSLESSAANKSRPGPARAPRVTPTGRVRTQLTQRPEADKTASPGPDTTNGRPTNQSFPWSSPDASQSQRSGKGLPRTNQSTGGLTEPPSTYGKTDATFGQQYRIDTPSIHPLSPQELEEEPDLFLEDYQQSQDIRHSAQQGKEYNGGPTSPLPNADAQASIEPMQPTYRITPLSTPHDDPFFYMEDALPPPPRSEQHGAVSVEGFNTIEHETHNIAAGSGDIIEGEVEYQGDLGDFVHIDSDIPPIPARAFVDDLPEDDEDMAGPSRVYGVRPRSSRSGRPSPLPPAPHVVGNDDGPAIDELPTLITPPIPSVPSPSWQQQQPQRPQQPAASYRTAPIVPLPLPEGSRPSQKLPAQRTPTGAAPRTATRQGVPVQRSGASRTGMQPGKSSTSAIGGRGAKGTTKTLPRPKPTASLRTPQRRQGIRGGAVFIVIALLFLAILGVIAYFGPSADVTVTVASHDLASNVTLAVSAKNTSTVNASTVPTQTLTQTFSTSGTGTVSGSTQVGTAKATGTVTFTNNGTGAVDIPSGTIVTTANSIQFVTTADALVNTSANAAGNSIPAPIQAQQAGETGNVAPGTITVLPPSSLSMIASQPGNPQASDIKLSVTNGSTTTGGGIGTATAVTQSDLDSLKKSLLTGLQPKIEAWQKEQRHSGDFADTPTITGTLIGAPSVGQVVDSGSFTASLKATVTMLVVRSADIQKGAIAALQGALKKNKSFLGYTVVSDGKQPVTIKNLQAKKTADGLSLSFAAQGKVAPDLPIDTVRKLIAGRSKSEAIISLKTLQGVQGVDIKTSPSFWSWVPFLTAHINVSFVAGSTPSSPPKK